MTSIRDANRIAELERKVRELEAWRATVECELSEMWQANVERALAEKPVKRKPKDG